MSMKRQDYPARWKSNPLRLACCLLQEAWTLQVAVIPAKAGIYSASLRKCAVDELDSRPSAS